MADEHTEQVPAQEVEEQQAAVEATEIPQAAEPEPQQEEPVAEVAEDAVAPEAAAGGDVEAADPAEAATAAGAGEATDEAVKAAAAKAVALAAQFAAHHEAHGEEPASNKRKPEDFGDEQPSAKVPNITYGAGGEITEVVQVASGMVGKLIGKSGVTIKEIQMRGQTRVKIEHEAVGDTKPVSIMGTPENVTRTKQLIKEALESESGAGFGGGAPGGGHGEAHRKVSCPAGIVGRIIGRGGETIRSLQTASQAHIVINQDFPQGEPREVEISGPADAVERAYGMVMELINSDGAASTQTVIQKFGQGITRILDCPKHMVGRIIGRGGETIKGLQKQFGASIQIDQNVAPCKVTVTGNASAVQAVEREIMNLMEDRPQGGGGGGFGGGPGFGGPAFPPYGGFQPPPFGGFGAPPFPGYGAPQAYGGFPAYNQPPAQPAYGGYGGYGAPAADPYAAGAYGGAAQGGHGYAQQQQQPQQQQQQAQQQPAAASVWQEMKDDQQRTYYYNSQTGVSQWERPADM